MSLDPALDLLRTVNPAARDTAAAADGRRRLERLERTGHRQAGYGRDDDTVTLTGSGTGAFGDPSVDLLVRGDQPGAGIEVMARTFVRAPTGGTQIVRAYMTNEGGFGLIGELYRLTQPNPTALQTALRTGVPNGTASEYTVWVFFPWSSFSALADVAQLMTVRLYYENHTDMAGKNGEYFSELWARSA